MRDRSKYLRSAQVRREESNLIRFEDLRLEMNSESRTMLEFYTRWMEMAKENTQAADLTATLLPGIVYHFNERPKLQQKNRDKATWALIALVMGILFKLFLMGMNG